MTTGTQGIELIKRWEGLRTTAYRDVGGLWTIGYGHLITDADSTLIGRTISEADAEQILRTDLNTAEAAVRNSITVPLAQHQFDALVSLVFNIGGGAFAGSTVRQRINTRAPESDTEEAWKRWNKVGAQVVQGLVNRRDAEWQLYSTGSTPIEKKKP